MNRLALLGLAVACSSPVKPPARSDGDASAPASAPAPAGDERRATVRIDAEPAGKKFQGVWLELADGRRWVVDYRPREIWRSFEDEEVLVTGHCYQPFGAAISATHFQVEQMRFAAAPRRSTPLVAIGPEETLTGSFGEVGYPEGSKRAGSREPVFHSDDGVTYHLFGRVDRPGAPGTPRTVTARRVEPDRAYAALPGGERIWVKDVHAADPTADPPRGPRRRPCPDPATTSPIPTCATLAECEAHDGERIEVVGVYTRYAWGFGKTREHRGHVQVALLADGGQGPLLEAYWHDDAVRAAGEVARFEGQRVAVVGRFLARTPPRPGDPPHAAHLAIAAIVDIESITPVAVGPPPAGRP
jgi:hypothetical protein